MLKKLFIILISILLLTACRPVSHNEENKASFSILSFRDASCFSLLPILNDDYSISTSLSYDTFNDAFVKNSYDIVISPIDVGVKKILEGSDYKLLAVLEFSTLKLYSDRDYLNYGQIGALNQNGVYTSVIEFLKKSDLKNYSVVWFNNIDEMMDSYNDNKISGVIVDEYNINYLKKNMDIDFNEIIDLNESYEYLTYYPNYPVCGLFVSNKLIDNNQNELVAFSRIIKTNISSFKNDKTALNNALINSDLNRLGFNDLSLIRESYDYCGLDFVYGSEIYDSIEILLEQCDIEVIESIVIK